MLKTPPASAGDMRHRVQSLGWDDVLEEGMETHSSFRAWEISDVGTWKAIIPMQDHLWCRGKVLKPGIKWKSLGWE